MTSLAARFASRRATLAPSPMIRPRSAACSARLRRRPAHQQHELVERRRRGVAVLAVDRLGLEGALDDAARRQLGGQRRVAAEAAGDRGEPDRQTAPRGRSSRRIAVAAEAPRRLAVELVRLAGRDRPARA